MSRLNLTIAFSDYDRVAALSGGLVQPDGIDLNFLTLPVEETFFRMARHAEFDVAEMSLSSYCMTLARDPVPFIAIPVFPSRVFRHGSMFVSTKSGIERPEQLAGKRIGYPEYQMTAPVWMRGILADEHGVKPSDVLHFSGGVEQPGRIEKLKLNLPPSIRWQAIAPEQTLATMLADGEVDALLAARPPSTLYSRPDDVRRLFPNHADDERAYYKRTGIFPIMHTVVIRRELYQSQRWIAQSLLKAFTLAQRKTYDDLNESHAFKAMLPWLPAHVAEARTLMGDDWWPYGFEANRHVLDTFLRYHHEQGLSAERLAPEQLFAPESLETFLI